MSSELIGKAKLHALSLEFWLEDTSSIRLKATKVQRRFRLTSPNDFKRVRQFGKSYAHPLIVLIAYPNESERTRISVSAGRSVGNAVQRNRAKRLIREVIRPMLPTIDPGWDILLLARKPMREASFIQTQGALFQLLRRANLYTDRYEC